MNIADNTMASVIRSNALNLMEKHGLLSQGWQFRFDRSLRRYGCCKHGRRHITISLPISLRNNLGQTTDTILHEIAHALVGVRAGHNHEWKRMAASIGATPERCYDAKEVVRPEGNYQAICSNCSHKFHAYRRHRRKSACMYCCKKYNGGKFSDQFLIQWSRVI